MFFEGDRIDYMRQMILAADEVQRRAALKMLLPFQKKDFAGLFKAMDGRPVTIRLLDPPLHEFLPHDDGVRRKLAIKLGVSAEFILDRIRALHEENPMLGCRGCRLGILYPEITEMQSRAIFEAAAQVMTGKNPVVVKPEIMIPLVGFKAELADQVEIVHRVAREVIERTGIKLDYLVGTMIEVPRAAITADELAEVAEFFSFGTNDLTQTTLGLSRDDMGSFFETYRQKEIYQHNPFASIDEQGVGRLITTAVERGRSTRPKIKLGICGEHAGDPASIAFCHRAGLDYVSCSPPRVPIARLAAAQAALRDTIVRKERRRAHAGDHLHRRPARPGERRVPRMFYDYADSGSWTESTYRENNVDFAPIKLRQRVAVNMDRRTLATHDDRRERVDAGCARAGGTHRHAARRWRNPRRARGRKIRRAVHAVDDEHLFDRRRRRERRRGRSGFSST